jgi:fructose-bisphosphate aldolase class 1
VRIDLAKTVKLPDGRIALVLRCVTALVGGYAAAAGLAALAARTLPIDRLDATMWALILSFAVYAGIGLWAFHERRLVRVAAVIWGIAILSGGAMLLLGMRP